MVIGFRLIRRFFLCAFVGAALAGLRLNALAAGEEPTGRKPPVVAIINPSPPVPHFRELIHEAARSLGYELGRNLILTEYWAGGSEERLRSDTAAAVGQKVDVLTVGTSAGVRAALAATSTIPIVAVDMESDPVANGWARSLAKPGKNLTGFFLDLPELSGKRLEQLKELIPHLSRVAVLWDALLDRAPLQATQDAARSLGLKLVIVEARRPDELPNAFAIAAKKRAQAVLMMPSPMLEGHAKQIATFAMERRLPIAGVFPTLAQAGFLLTYGPNVDDLVRRSVVYTDRILKGERAGDLPIQHPVKFELVLNAKTANALGIHFPQSFLTRADRVIK
ncbi:MAG: ABC transporter substrate-binding protein [Proteobacteria bacterium]|nr:MAG: ABC transporter substrate-binding protein [Pseudomonadota bacterium]